MSKQNFSSLPLNAEFLKNLKALKYTQMTPIQSLSLPSILENKDILAQAETGSGKTAAFAIGLLHKLDTQLQHTQALIICPTRELADQVSKETRRLARAIPNTKIITLCGGKPMQPQLTSLQHAPHIVVGTPGRLLKHLEKETLNIKQIKTLVLDEADRMLDMGFHEDIMRIIHFTPNQRQTLLFSATYPDDILSISNTIQQKPIKIEAPNIDTDKKIKQLFFEIQKGERAKTLKNLLGQYKPESCIVFCNRKQQCNELAEYLWQEGFHAQALHGDLEQKDRDRVLVQFSNNSSSILIATDVAARGIDIKDLPLVINYELAHDPEIHIHRIGRTGRAGKEGLALSLFMPTEAKKINAIEDYQNGAVKIKQSNTISASKQFKLTPSKVTLLISAGRKNKVRAGDILGALTSGDTLNGNQIGKIDIFDNFSYVAIERDVAKIALKVLSDGKIKGRKFRVKKLS